MASRSSLVYFFETPLIVDRVPDAAALNAELRERIEERRAQDAAGLSLSNHLGWHSDTRMMDWGGDAATRLVERVINLAERFTEDIGAVRGPRYIWWPEMWANVSRQGASNQFHTHPGAYWAVVYYVDDGYSGSDDAGLGGEIVFEDPRMPMLHMEEPNLRFRPGPGMASPQSTYAFRPAAGTVLMFPAWLRHGVNPYFGAGTRISIALNLSAMIPPESSARI